MKITLIGASILLLSTLMVAPIAHASPSTTVSGTSTVTSSTLTDIRFADGNIIITGTFVGVDTGGLFGTFVGGFVEVVHPDGSSVISFSGSETASVLGSPVGTFSWSGSSRTSADGFDSGLFTISQGTGGLKGLHGVITLFSPFAFSPSDDYSGQVHFDPA